jgi:hypothetical protein
MVLMPLTAVTQEVQEKQANDVLARGAVAPDVAELGAALPAEHVSRHVEHDPKELVEVPIEHRAQEVPELTPGHIAHELRETGRERGAEDLVLMKALADGALAIEPIVSDPRQGLLNVLLEGNWRLPYINGLPNLKKKDPRQLS